MWDDGLIPVVFLIPDDISPVTMDQIKRKLTPFLDKTKDLIRVAATGWEVNGWMSADVMTQSAIWLRSQLESGDAALHPLHSRARGGLRQRRLAKHGGDR